MYRRKGISLKDAIEFHGHLGPYLVIGLLAGDFALKALKCKKYFGLQVKVWGAAEKPKSCLIDGLQLSTGATFGKGNIEKLSGPAIKIEARARGKNNKIVLKLKQDLLEELEKIKTHRESETLAKKLFNSRYFPFDLSPLTLDP